MKQTAVEFLIEELNNIKSSSTDQYGKITLFEDEFIRVLDQAKEMEKEQHSDTWDDSRICDMGDDYLGKQKSFQEYYN